MADASSTETPAPRRVHFNHLPLELRTRLRGVLKNHGAVLEQKRRSSPGEIIAALVVSVLFGGLAVHFLRAGYGEPYASGRYLTPWAIPFLALGITFPLAVLLSGLAAFVDPPYPLGIYVLDVDLVDARGPVLVVTPLRTLKQAVDVPTSGEITAYQGQRLFGASGPRRQRPAVTFTFGGWWRPAVFRIVDAGRAKDIQKTLERNAKLCADGDGAWLQQHDLFRSVRGTPWSTRAGKAPSEGPRISTLSRLAAAAPLVALVIGLAAAPVIWHLRNTWSETRAHAAASR